MAKTQTEKFDIVDYILLAISILGVIAYGISFNIVATNEVAGVIVSIAGFGAFATAGFLGISRSMPVIR